MASLKRGKRDVSAIILIVLGSVLGLAILCIWLTGDSRPAATSVKPETTPKPAETISAVDLYAAYKQNGVAADRRLKGRWISVSGVVDTISKDVNGNRYLKFQVDRDYSIFGVQCFFGERHDYALSQMAPGMYASNIVGRCAGDFGNVQLHECFFTDGAMPTETDR